MWLMTVSPSLPFENSPPWNHALGYNRLHSSIKVLLHLEILYSEWGSLPDEFVLNKGAGSIFIIIFIKSILFLTTALCIKQHLRTSDFLRRGGYALRSIFIAYNFTITRMFEFENLVQKSVRFTREKGILTRHISIQ
jgi:hypothetical protein